MHSKVALRVRPRHLALFTLAACAAAVVGGAVAGGCGGVGVEAPHVIGADEDTGCPSADDALAHARAALGLDGSAGELAELRPVIERVLVEQGGIRVVVQGIAALLEDADQVTLERLLQGIDPAQGLGRVTPHVVEVLRYIEGSSAYVPGPHPEPLQSVHEIFVSCDAAATVSTLRFLLLLEVNSDDATGAATLLPAGDDGERAWLGAVLDAARAVVEDPVLRAAFERIELEEGEGADGEIRVGKDAFALLAKLLAANLAAPDFDPQVTRELLETVIGSQVNDETSRARLDALLDVALLITDPAVDVFPHVQSLMACVNDADESAAIPSMLYDWLTIEELSVNTFLADVSGSTDSDAAADLRLALIDVLRALEARPQVTRDLVGNVGAAFIDDETAPILVRTMLALQGKGLVAELSGLTEAIAACDR